MKATGVGDNKNMLIELNIEQTRHNEIQLLGNGEWCISLGGRDCSLQMHEQKLVEVSVTQEGLRDAIAARARRPGRPRRPRRSRATCGVLERMEDEAERFGQRREARLRVDLRVHRRRRPPLLHGGEHPHPGRAPRVRALLRAPLHQPRRPERRASTSSRWSRRWRSSRGTRSGCRSPARVHARRRRDRGAPERHRPRAQPRRRRRHRVVVGPDRRRDPRRPGHLHQEPGHRPLHALPPGGRLRLERRAAARDRREPRARAGRSWSRSSAAPRSAAWTSRPTSSSTTACSSGSWRATRGPSRRPSSSCRTSRWSASSRRKRSAIDLDYAFQQIARARHRGGRARGARRHPAGARPQGDAARAAASALLFEEPHFLSAWLSQHRLDFAVRDGRVDWRRNPVEVLAETYRLLNMDDDPARAAAHRIWDHDRELLDTALAFYAKLARARAAGHGVARPRRDAARPTARVRLRRRRRGDASAPPMRGHQLGLEILGAPAADRGQDRLLRPARSRTT